MQSLDDSSRQSHMGADSNRSSMDFTARFGGTPGTVPTFGSNATSPAISDKGPVAQFGGGRTGHLMEVEALGTSDLGSIADSQQAPYGSGRLPSQYELATPVIMQEITQNLRKTMVGLSNEVKARENENWRLEQGFTQLDSRRELMCVQLHTRYEQTKHELEAMGRTVLDLQGQSSHPGERSLETDSKLQQFSNAILSQSEESRRIGTLAANLESENSNLKALIERLQEKQSSLEARAGVVEAKCQASIALCEAGPRDTEGKAPVPAGLEEYMEKQSLLENRCSQLEEANLAFKSESNSWRQAAVDCKVVAAESAQFEKRCAEMESKSVGNTVKLDALQDSLSQLEASIMASEEHQRGKLQDAGVERAGQKAQIESLQENLSQVQAWLQKQRLIEEKRAQIDTYNAAHRQETDDLRNSIKHLEGQRESQAPVDARSAALDAREVAQRVELKSMASLLDAHKALMTSELNAVVKSVDGSKLTHRAELDSMASSVQQLGKSVEEVWAGMAKSIQQFNASVDDVRSGQTDAKSAQAENMQSVKQLNEAIQELRLGANQGQTGGSIQITEEKFAMIEARIAENNVQHKVAADRLRDSMSELQLSCQRCETKLQDFDTSLAGQGERVKIELGLQDIKTELSILTQSKLELQSRMDALQTRAEIAQIQATDTAKMSQITDSAETQRKVSQLEAQGGDQQRECLLLRSLLDSLQGRLESYQQTQAVQTQADSAQSQLREEVRKECEAMVNVKLQAQEKPMEELFKKLGTSAEALRGFVEMETSGAQAGIQQIQTELKDDRRRRADEVTRLETKDAQQEVVLAEFRSRLDLQTDVVRSQLEHVVADGRPSSDESSVVAVAEARAQISSLRAHQSAVTDALQTQQEEVRTQLQKHILTCQEKHMSLAQRLDASAALATSLEKTMAACEMRAGAGTPAAVADSSMWEDLMITKLGDARKEWQAALDEQRTKNSEMVRLLGRSVTEDCRTQAATQARIVVQSMLSQELDSWRRELKTIPDKISGTTPVPSSRGPKASGSEADDDDRATEPPGLSEAVRRLDDRLAMQRREAAALDELLRSELEVQRRQQSLTSTTMQTIQDRLMSVEERTEAFRSQLEDALREGLPVDLESHSTTPGGARFQSALTDIADGVRGGVVVNVNPLTAVALTPLDAMRDSHASSSTGDDIHRRIKALSAKMAACQGTSADGSNAGGMPHQASAGTLDTLGTSRGISRMDDTSQGPVFDALNMPQALTDLMAPGGHANYAFRQPSIDRTSLQLSSLPSSSPTNSRGLYAYRQMSPSAASRNPPPGYGHGPPQRQLSPGPQRSSTHTTIQVSGGSMTTSVGQMSPRRNTPARSLLPENRISRLSSLASPIGAPLQPAPIGGGPNPWGGRQSMSNQIAPAPSVGVPPSPPQPSAWGSSP